MLKHNHSAQTALLWAALFCVVQLNHSVTWVHQEKRSDLKNNCCFNHSRDSDHKPIWCCNTHFYLLIKSLFHTTELTANLLNYFFFYYIKSFIASTTKRFSGDYNCFIYLLPFFFCKTRLGIP